MAQHYVEVIHGQIAGEGAPQFRVHLMEIHASLVSQRLKLASVSPV